MNNLTINIYESYPNISKMINKPYDNYDLYGTIFEIVTEKADCNSLIFGYYFLLDFLKNSDTIQLNFDILAGDSKTNDYYFSDLKKYKTKKRITIKVDNEQESLTLSKKDSLIIAVEDLYNIDNIVLQNIKKIHEMIEKYNIEFEPHRFANTINGFIQHLKSDDNIVSFFQKIEHSYLNELSNTNKYKITENKKTKLKL